MTDTGDGKQGALHGITVLDFTQVYMGPCCTQLLGDHGADVIKIEHPENGDLSRTAIIDRDGLDNPIFLSINRNKRSVALNVRDESGRQVIYDLARSADVVVSNFRAGVMERLGFGYEDLRAINPGVIWACGTGFGPRGPYQHKGGQDVLMQAYTGVMWRRADDDLPLAIYPTTLCDYTAGMHLLQGILLALLYRERTGEGQKVEVAMYDSMLAMQMQEACMQLNRGYEVNWGAAPLSGVFPTADGAITLVGAFKANPLRSISAALEIDDLSLQEEFGTAAQQAVHRSALHRIFAAQLGTNTTSYWMRRLEEQDVLCAPVRTMIEALQDEQTQINGMVADFRHPVAGTVHAISSPIHMSASPAALRYPPPRLGEHAEEVLRENGYTEARIAQLREGKVLR